MSISKLDLFKLCYILLHSIGWELVYTDQFLAYAPILYPLRTSAKKTKKNQVFSRIIKCEQWQETA